MWDANKQQVQNVGNAQNPGIVLVSEGVDFHRAVAAVMHQARSLVQPFASEVATEPSPSDHDDLHAQWRENWYDGLGYCMQVHEFYQPLLTR